MAASVHHAQIAQFIIPIRINPSVGSKDIDRMAMQVKHHLLLSASINSIQFLIKVILFQKVYVEYYCL